MWIVGACDSGGKVCRVEVNIQYGMNEGVESIDECG